MFFNTSVNGLWEFWMEMLLFDSAVNHYFIPESRNFPKIAL